MLVVDIGNSRVKWASVRDGGLVGHGAADYQDDTLEQRLDAALGHLDDPGAVAYCSVGASTTGKVLEGWAAERWGVHAARVLTAAEGFGVRCAYPRPETLGADRWAALVACRHQGKGAAVVVDCGTAITLDAISEAGEHLGGVIVPGVMLMRLALTTRTDQIPAQDSDSREVLAKSTADGVAAGTFYAAAAAVDRLAREMGRYLPPGSARILTGGAMESLRPLMLTAFQAEPHLVLYGLAVIAGAIR
jgi:type III pantothenate kinase